MRLLMICIFSLLFQYNPLAAQKSNDKRNYYNVYVNYPDYTVRAAIRKKPATFKAVTDQTYYWYAANQVNTTQGGYDGKLLHGNYTAFYLNNNLKEKGKFVNGLKEGQWQSWHPDGKRNELVHFKKGMRNGKYESYDSKGRLVVKATFKGGKLHGKSETYLNGELSATRFYKNGEEFTPKQKTEKVKTDSTDTKAPEGKKKLFKGSRKSREGSGKSREASQDNELKTDKKTSRADAEIQENPKPKKKHFNREKDPAEKEKKSKKKAADKPTAEGDKKS